MTDYAERAGLSAGLVADVRLAVSEAVTNVIVHAYRDRVEPGVVRVSARGCSLAFWVVIEDDGTGMQPRADSPGAGLGLPMIATVAHNLDIERSPSGGTRLTLCFEGPRFTSRERVDEPAVADGQ